jgi:hypothetical protein
MKSRLVSSNGRDAGKGRKHCAKRVVRQVGQPAVDLDLRAAGADEPRVRASATNESHVLDRHQHVFMILAGESLR